MTRREEIIEKAQCIEHYGMQEQFAFIAGAQWADKTMIDKACEWLYVYYPTLERSKSAEDAWDKFKKAMEE